MVIFLWLFRCKFFEKSERNKFFGMVTRPRHCTLKPYRMLVCYNFINFTHIFIYFPLFFTFTRWAIAKEFLWENNRPNPEGRKIQSWPFMMSRGICALVRRKYIAWRKRGEFLHSASGKAGASGEMWLMNGPGRKPWKCLELIIKSV